MSAQGATRESRADHAYGALLDDLMRGRWEIGATLSSYALAHELDMSRTPVTEALRRLERDGLVEIVPQVGCRVVAHRARSLEELLSLRAALEGLAAAVAAPRLTAEELAGLQRLVAELTDAGRRGDAPRFWAVDEALHVAIAEASRMPRLVAAVRNLWTTLRRSLDGSPVAPETAEALGEQHAQLVAALARGSSRDARRAMEEHVWRTAIRLLEGLPWATDGDAFEHHAVVLRSAREWSSSVVPFVLAGLDRGEPVLAVVGRRTLAELERLLGRRAAHIEFHDAAEWYAAPACTLHQFERYADTPRDGRARIVGTLGADRGSAVPAAEWTRLEAQLDAALAGHPVSMLCVYDAASLPPDLLGDAHRTHAAVLDAARPADAPAHVPGARLLRELDAVGLPEPPVPTEHRPVTRDLRDLRTHVLDRARTAGLGARRRQQLLLAVQEAARVVLARDPARGRLRSWVHDDTLVFELHGEAAAPGPVPSRPSGLASALTEAPGDLGAARLICDLVQVRSHDRSLVLRLHSAL